MSYDTKVITALGGHEMKPQNIHPANTIHFITFVQKSAQRFRRWSNIVQIL